MNHGQIPGRGTAGPCPPKIRERPGQIHLAGEKRQACAALSHTDRTALVLSSAMAPTYYFPYAGTEG